MELRFPPIVVLLVSVGTMWSVAGLGVLTMYEVSAVSAVAAIVLVILGLRIGAAGLAAFRRAGTTADPRTPGEASVLVRSGIYTRTRNPMYLGMAMVLTGWAVYLGDVGAAAVVPLFVLYMNAFQIKPEERALRAKFGQEYDEYCSVVRRWL